MNDQPRFSQLILASGSAPRKELLERLALPFTVIPADIDETPGNDEAPVALARRLTRQKAELISRKHPNALVIGSDQVAVFKDVPTGKPGTAERARQTLRQFSGQTVTFLTGVCVASQGVARDAHLDRTIVTFRSLADDEINRYVERDDPVACAGSFKIEALGPSLFEQVRSEDPTALPGLPLIRLTAMLRAAGYRIP